MVGIWRGKNSDKKMTFTEHLEELRRRIIISLIAILIGALGGYLLLPQFLTHLIKPLGKLVFISPTEAFWINIRLSFYIGIVLAMPIVFYQIWRFIESGLRTEEKRFALPLTIFSSLFFLCGGFFAYFLILPVGLKFLLGFSRNSLIPMISVNRYVSFLVGLLVGFGFIFELPLISFFLAKMGIVTDKFLSSNRRYAIIIIFIVAAILTPPDIFTQLLMAVPLFFLYEASVLVSKFTCSKNK